MCIISTKSTLHVQHTFFVHSFAVFLHDYNVKLPETSQLHVVWRKCRTCSCHFFFTVAYFHLALVATSISYFLTAATKLSCCSSNKKMSPLLFLALDIFRPFSRFISLACRLLSLFLCCSHSIFQICGHAISLSLILQTTWIQKQFSLSVFVFIDS